MKRGTGDTVVPETERWGCDLSCTSTKDIRTVVAGPLHSPRSLARLLPIPDN